MATNQEDGGSRLWRGMRALIFGDDETTLRDQIEEVIDDAEDQQPVAGDLSPHERIMMRNLLHFGDRTAGDVCVTRGDIISVPSDISFDDLVILAQHYGQGAGHAEAGPVPVPEPATALIAGASAFLLCRRRRP